jgi:hypothetical protein
MYVRLTRVTALAVLLLAGGPGAGQAQVVLGRLLDASTGAPVVMGYVALLTEHGEPVVWTLTNETGLFRLEAPETGSYLMYGESLGYLAGSEGPLSLGEDETLRVEFALAALPIAMDSLRVVARYRVRSLDRAGFYQRQEQGFGHFIGPEKIRESFSARRITDLLWGVPGVRLLPATGLAGSGWVPVMRRAMTLRGTCLPAVYLDGVPFDAEEIDRLILPMDIDAMEVYRGSAGLPARFASLGSACGVIVIWSRTGRD